MSELPPPSAEEIARVKAYLSHVAASAPSVLPAAVAAEGDAAPLAEPVRPMRRRGDGLTPRERILAARSTGNPRILDATLLALGMTAANRP